MATSIDEALKQLRDPTITEVDLRDSNFGDTEAERIAEALAESTVTKLTLYNNQIGDAGAKALSAALPKSSITTLYFDCNQIGDAGTAALAAVLPETSIDTLWIGDNQVGDAGAAALAAALPESSVTVLWLPENNIGAAGAEALAAALPVSSLTELTLNSNQIGDVGATALAMALPGSSLNELTLGDNHISDVGTEALTLALPKSSVAWLFLEDNDIEDYELDERRTEAYTANRILSEKLASVLAENRALSAEDYAALPRMAPAVYDSLCEKHDMTPEQAQRALLEEAERLLESGGDAIPLIVGIKPLSEARDWLKERDVTLTLSNFLNPDGTLPQDRFLCRGGIAALFAQEDWWHDKTTFRKALHSIPEEQRGILAPNSHMIAAKLSRGAVSATGVSM